MDYANGFFVESSEMPHRLFTIDEPVPSLEGFDILRVLFPVNEHNLPLVPIAREILIPPFLLVIT